MTANAAERVESIARKMLDEHVGAVLIEADDQLVGVLTDRDIVCRVLAQGLKPENTSASQVMSSPAITGRVKDSIDSAILRMRENGIRRLPIIDEDGSLRGIVTLDDLLVLLSAELRQVGEVPVVDRGP